MNPSTDAHAKTAKPSEPGYPPTQDLIELARRASSLIEKYRQGRTDLIWYGQKVQENIRSLSVEIASQSSTWPIISETEAFEEPAQQYRLEAVLELQFLSLDLGEAMREVRLPPPLLPSPSRPMTQGSLLR